MTKTTGRAYVDIHILQYLPPNNINRDDVGRPKTAIVGGTTRARVSSPRWSRAARLKMTEHIDKLKGDKGIRSKYLLSTVSSDLVEMSGGKLSKADANELVMQEAVRAGIVSKVPSKEDAVKDNTKVMDGVDDKELVIRDSAMTTQLMFLTERELKEFTQAVYDMWVAKASDSEKKAKYKEILTGNSFDVVLFGRMMASSKDLTVEACASVAHAISTHEAKVDFDFFTGVDELNNEGSGHLGAQELISGVMYRYSTVSIHELFDKYSKEPEEIAELLKAYIESFVYSMPTGKTATTGPYTFPAAVMISVRDDRPQSLADAFVNPVRGEGLVDASIKALELHIRSLSEDHRDPVESYVTSKLSSDLGERLSFKNDEEVYALVSGIVERAVRGF